MLYFLVLSFETVKTLLLEHISCWCEFQGGTSFVDLLCFCSALCLLCLCARLFICALWSPAWKGLTSWLSFVVSTVSLSLSHWYPGSGVVLDCIDSWSLHPYLLWTRKQFYHLGVSLCTHKSACYFFFRMVNMDHQEMTSVNAQDWSLHSLNV